jgi:hypothetical protein
MASELGHFLAVRYKDRNSLKEVMQKIPAKIKQKAGEAAGDRFLESGNIDCAFIAYSESGNPKKLMLVGDKALEKGNLSLTFQAYDKANEIGALDPERKDILHFLRNEMG